MCVHNELNYQDTCSKYNPRTHRRVLGRLGRTDRTQACGGARRRASTRTARASLLFSL